MAKRNVKRANSQFFFQIRNKCSPKGNKSKYLPHTDSRCQLRCANKQSKGSNYTPHSESKWIWVEAESEFGRAKSYSLWK